MDAWDWVFGIEGGGELAGSEERKGWSSAGAVVFFIPKPSLLMVTPSQISWSTWCLIAPLLMAMECSADPFLLIHIPELTPTPQTLVHPAAKDMEK